MIKNTRTLFILLTFSLQLAISQSSSEAAQQLVLDAVYLMDNGEIDESLVKLAQARKLDPENLLYLYETAIAYYKKKDYSKSIQVLDSIKNHPDASDQVFQMLGNVYDDNGERERALETYRLGMEKFPESGVFHQELGNIEYSDDNYSEAVKYWEDGLKIDPTYPSNYYRLAKVHSHSSEKMWSLIYGELFILLEPTTARSEEISKLLFETYQEVYSYEKNAFNIDKLSNIGSQSLMARKNDSTNVHDRKESFEEVYFSSSLVSSPARQIENQIEISNILNTRKSFLDYWYNQKEFNKSYRNKLFDYQKLMLENSLFETYTYWLLAYGNPEEFQAYYYQNTEKVSEFAKWFEKNRIQLSRSDIFSRQDYN